MGQKTTYTEKEVQEMFEKEYAAVTHDISCILEMLQTELGNRMEKSRSNLPSLRFYRAALLETSSEILNRNPKEIENELAKHG